MTHMRMLLALILPLLLSFSYLPPKGDVYPGYVILDSGEKVEGLVVLGTFIERELKIRFIDRGKKKAFSPEDIQAYGFEQTKTNDLGKAEKSWVHYERMEALEPPRIFAPTNVFVEREVDGDLDLFCFYIQQRSNIEKPYDYYYLLRGEDGKLQKVTEDNFTKAAKKHFAGYTALIDRLGKKQFTFKNIGRLVRDYNYWVIEQHDPATYVVSPENYDSAD